MGNQTPNNYGSGEERISQLLSALPRVEAPGDFSFHVKSRIAKGKPAEARPFWFSAAAKGALPLALMLAVGGYFGYSALYPGNETGPVFTAEQTLTPPAAAQAPSTSATSTQVPPAAVPSETEVAKVTVEQDVPKPDAARSSSADRAAARKPARQAPTPDGSSYDAAATSPQKLTPNEDSSKQPEAAVKGSPAGEVLIRIGVNALFGEGGWKAESVKPNTAAAKAGIKAGDVIQAVDDQTMTDLGSVAKPAKGKKIRVLREGKTVDIVIEP